MKYPLRVAMKYGIKVGKEKYNMTIEDFANSLTTAQYTRLLDIAYGEVPDDILAMSDDEILAELED